MRHPTLGGRNHASCLIQAAQGLRAINLNSQRVCGINAIADRTVHRGAGGDQPLEQRIKHIILAAGDVEQLGAVARRGAQRGNGAAVIGGSGQSDGTIDAVGGQVMHGLEQHFGPHGVRDDMHRGGQGPPL